MMMRESALSHRAAAESLPLRDAFAVLFFVSVGMLFEPEIVLREPLKLATVVGLVLAFRYPLTPRSPSARASRRSASSPSSWRAWA